MDGVLAERHGRRAGIRVGNKHHAAETGETPREWRLKAQPGSRSCLDDEWRRECAIGAWEWWDGVRHAGAHIGLGRKQQLEHRNLKRHSSGDVPSRVCRNWHHVPRKCRWRYQLMLESRGFFDPEWKHYAGGECSPFALPGESLAVWKLAVGCCRLEKTQGPWGDVSIMDVRLISETLELGSSLVLAL